MNLISITIDAVSPINLRIPTALDSAMQFTYEHVYDFKITIYKMYELLEKNITYLS